MSYTIDQIAGTSVLPRADDFLESGGRTAGVPRSAKVLAKNFAQKVETIAALRALDIANAADGLIVFVQGYYAAGDGDGHGEFRYSAGAVDADNGGTVIAPAAGAGRWLRLWDSTLNVRWFGAKGDAATDDTAAVQAAIDDAAKVAQQVRTVYFPPGRYAVSSLNCSNKPGLRLEGASWFQSHIMGFKQILAAPVLDAAGTGIHLSRLTVGGTKGDGSVPDVVPTVGVLLAETTTYGAGTAHWDEVYISGFFSVAAVFVCGSTECTYIAPFIENRQPNAPTIIFSSNNSEGVTSPNATLAAAPVVTNNHVFWGGEVGCAQASPSTAPAAIVIDNRAPGTVYHLGGIKFAGTILRGAGGNFVLVKGPGTVSNLEFSGVFDTEGGVVPTVNGVYIDGATVQGLVFAYVMGSPSIAATGALIRGSATAIVTGLHIPAGVFLASGAHLLKFDDHAAPSTLRIRRSVLNAQGTPITPGGSIGADVIILDPGTITLPAGATYYAAISAGAKRSTMGNGTAEANLIVDGLNSTYTGYILKHANTEKWLIGWAGESLDDLVFRALGASNPFRFSTAGALTLADKLTTGAPAGGAATAWKLGEVADVAPAPNKRVRVQIGANTYWVGLELIT